MLDFFVIFSKGGIVLFATVNQAISQVVNKLIKHVILEERRDEFTCDNLALKYHLDNEFDLVFVVGYQKMLTLSYVDKFLDDIQLAFRDKFTDYDLRKILKSKGNGQHLASSLGDSVSNSSSLSSPESSSLLSSLNLVDFYHEYKIIYTRCCKQQQNIPQPEMRSFQQSTKSQKTVKSMIIQSSKISIPTPVAPIVAPKVESKPESVPILAKLSPRGVRPEKPKKKEAKPIPKGKKAKEARQWELGGKSSDDLDFSKKTNGAVENTSSIAKNIASGDIGATIEECDVEPDLEFECSDEEEEEDDVEIASSTNKKSFFGSLIKSMSINKALTRADLDPILNQLRDHLISKNVAAEIATKLCDSVATKLEGQTVNTWIGLKSFVRNALEESMLRILSPNRNLNILRDIRAKSVPPYVIVFCGVNGVGKSTNLAKIANWLVVNGNKVLIVACDTFRAGAIEQLRTHVTALKTIHERDGAKKIDLYEKGYGKDSAAIAMEAINYARTSGYTVCLVDTAGRMQDNEPLMKQLAKLIKINEPDLTLFVGEALVGNEAVDQLGKFNTALLDNGCRGVTSNASAINGIVLTKFDTIDDQVGAAISMTYITGQPIVFVGVGQTYKDLKQLNAKAVVKALMK
ncbi:signal recognition particle receptor subunit alpha homolog [Tetranychus urticae]|uniref:SRP54-type proteins GTP-binding domain-containing protein n=1 Tax=Tetranychus urticae TaxID=32264 RepID=T1KAS9_TETUR|nr:signal recognition particle receptor subunit alpha homolog [Tetranychus urticae]